MKPINDFPHTLYFKEHIAPLLGEAYMANIKGKYAPAVEEKYGPHYSNLSVYDLLTVTYKNDATGTVEDIVVGDDGAVKTVVAHVLVEIASGQMPDSAHPLGIDQIRLFARWVDSPRLECVPPLYNTDVPVPHFFGDHTEDDDKHEHHHLLRHFTRHIHND